MKVTSDKNVKMMRAELKALMLGEHFLAKFYERAGDLKVNILKG